MRSLAVDDGVLVALVLAALGAAGVWWSARRDGSAVVGFATIAVVAALAGMWVESALAVGLVVALVLLGLTWAVDPETPLVRAVVFVGGALLVAGELDGLPTWMHATAFVGTLVAAPLAVSLDRASARSMPIVLLISVGGVYLCAPDTELTLVLLGALAPVALLALLPQLRASVAVASLAGLVVWVAVLEGRGRPGAVVGSVACLGVVLVAPLLRWRATSLRAVILLLATQALLVLFVSRVAGLRESAWAALALCVPAFVVAAAVLMVVNRHEVRGAPSPSGD